MTEEPDVLRSVLFARNLNSRADIEQRQVIERYESELEFESLENLMICAAAWEHVAGLGVPPRLVFAHPDILRAHPRTSLYYRGLALLSRKQVSQSASNVTGWEDGTHRGNVHPDLARKVACLFNYAISTIIVGSADWTMENGYRNIVATMGITLDGQFRNRIGRMAETHIKGRILDWLKDRGLIAPEEELENKNYDLPNDTIMRYASEPDVAFLRDNRLIASIEVKGGRDPAGALERLGAMTKSFAETPAGCVNFLVAGVITLQMQARLDEIGVVKVYPLDKLSQDGEQWDDFTNEVFHHAVRVI